MVRISKAIVIVVVRKRGDQGHEDIHIRQLGKRDKFTFFQKEVDHLKHIRSMHVIVIRHRSVVSFEDYLNKIQQFLHVKLLKLVNL